MGEALDRVSAGWLFHRRMRRLAGRAGLATYRHDRRTCIVYVPAGGRDYPVLYTADGTLFVPSRWRFPAEVPYPLRHGMGRINTVLGTAAGLSWHRDSLPDGHVVYLRLERPPAGLTPAEFRETAEGLTARVAGMDAVIGRYFSPQEAR